MNFLKKLLSRKKRVLSTTISNTEPLATKIYSQPHALAMRMYGAQIKHGELVEANLNRVRIQRTDRNGETAIVGDLTAFFCPLDQIEVLDRLKPGDDEPYPTEVKMHNFNLPSDFSIGTYNIKNVMLYANGVTNVMATKNTTLERIED